MSGSSGSEKTEASPAVRVRAGTPGKHRTGYRAQVLRERAAFEAVLRTGARLASRNFVLRAGPNEVPYPRLGIIAAKKVAARAVDRNRARRLIREVFRAASAELGSYDITIQLRGDLRGELNDGVRAELAKLLQSLARRTGKAPEREPDRQ